MRREMNDHRMPHLAAIHAAERNTGLAVIRRLEAVHQQSIGRIVIVEELDHFLSSRQGPVPLQFGCNRGPVDGDDPRSFPNTAWIN